MEKKFIKDFSDTSYRNPKLLRRQRSRRNKIIMISTIFFLVLIVVAFILLLFTPYFRIQKIGITGLSTIAEDDIRQIINKELDRGIFLRHNNVFLFDPKVVRENISQAYLLEWIEIQKQTYPAQILISLEEKVSSLTYLTQENCFNIDLQGFIVEKCNNLSSGFIQIRDESNQLKDIGDQALSQEDIDYIIDLNEQLEGQGIEVRTFKIISPTSSDLRVLTVRGYEIYFNKSMEIKEQLIRFNILVREEIGAENLDKVNYIDLRFGEKVFYR